MKKYLIALLMLFVLFLFGCDSMKENSLDVGKDDGSPSYHDDSYSGDPLPSGERYDEAYSGDPLPSGERYDEAYSGKTSELEPEGGYYYIPGSFEGDKVTGEYHTTDGGMNSRPRAGQMTASVTMDNEKYDFWKSLLIQGQEKAGEFKGYNDNFAFKTANRIVLTFPKGAYVKASLVDGDKVVFTAVADANGVCNLFSNVAKDSYKVNIEYLNTNNELVVMDDEVTGNKEYDFEALNANKELIELLFVIDTTGSMGDEILFLQSEITDVVNKVKLANSNIKIRLGIIVYRDKGDEYLTKVNDFSEDIESQVGFLNKQYASGGGDYEEAVQEAFLKAKNMQWSDLSTKIIVHVADAPAHDSDVVVWNNLVLDFAKMGIRIITVASSGIDKKAEYFFRCQSLLTSGAYVHITNDSGIGGGHIDASTEEKEVVELLNDALVRLINGFYTGDFGTAVDYKQSQTSPLS